MPTRELALQVAAHLQEMVPKQRLHVGVLVGGLSIEKQKRVLDQRPPVLVCTPGRLIAMLKHEHLRDIGYSLSFLIVDEADRMVEKGTWC